MKTLDWLVGQSRVSAGLRFLGDGKSALILDVSGLFDVVVGEQRVYGRSVCVCETTSLEGG